MSTPVVMPDAEREAIDILAAHFAVGTVSTSYPSTTLTGSTIRVQVDAEPSSVVDYPATERTPVRVVVHAAPGQRTAVKDAADDCLRYMFAATGRPNVSGVKAITGRSSVATDPDTKNLMCWFIVRLDLLGTPA